LARYGSLRHVKNFHAFRNWHGGPPKSMWLRKRFNSPVPTRLRVRAPPAPSVETVVETASRRRRDDTTGAYAELEMRGLLFEHCGRRSFAVLSVRCDSPFVMTTITDARSHGVAGDGCVVGVTPSRVDHTSATSALPDACAHITRHLLGHQLRLPLRRMPAVSMKR